MYVKKIVDLYLLVFLSHIMVLYESQRDISAHILM